MRKKRDADENADKNEKRKTESDEHTNSTPVGHPISVSHLPCGHTEGAGAGGLGQDSNILLLSWQSAAPIGLSPLTTIHQAAVLAHCFCFSVGGRSIVVRLSRGFMGFVSLNAAI